MLTIRPIDLPREEPTETAVSTSTPSWLCGEPPQVVPAFVSSAHALTAEPQQVAAAPAAPAVDPQVQAERELERQIAEVRAEAERAGREAAEAAVRAEWDARAERLEGLLAELADARVMALAGLEEQVCELSLAVARAIVSDAAHDEAMLRELVREALELLGDADTLTLRVAPADLEVVSKAARELSEGQSRLRISADPQLSQGCIVDTAEAQVDATLEGRLAQVRQALLAGGGR